MMPPELKQKCLELIGQFSLENLLEYVYAKGKWDGVCQQIAVNPDPGEEYTIMEKLQDEAVQG